MEKLDLRKHLAARVIRFLTDRLSPTAGAGIAEISATLLLVDLFGRVPGLEKTVVCGPDSKLPSICSEVPRLSNPVIPCHGLLSMQIRPASQVDHWLPEQEKLGQVINSSR